MESAFTLISLIFVGPHIHGQPQLTIPNPSNQASISRISQGRGSTVPSVSEEASSSAGINSTHLHILCSPSDNALPEENSGAVCFEVINSFRRSFKFSRY